MKFEPGTLIATYEIVAALGAGAMGEVYRARDTSLGRDVALKVLPEEFAQDEERLQRFVREAKLLAQLNHPGIAGIHGLESEGATRFIVMELVDGETLGERIARGAIPWRDAVEIAVQVADALDAAHEAGIVHRDLKPDNVGLTADGKAKLLDFGIGKPMSEELQRAIGSSQQMTRAGAILGTPTYICPEQFKGKPVDRRADLWAFGCLLYEMLTGAPAFPGETVGEIAASVLNQDPDWTALPGDAPMAIARLVRDCLQKDPRDRLRDMGEARRGLERVEDVEPQSRPAGPAGAATGQRSWWWLVAALVLGTAVGLGAPRWFGPGPEEPDAPPQGVGDAASTEAEAAPTTPEPLVMFQVALPDNHSLNSLFASPTGDSIGAVLHDMTTGETSIWIKRLDAPALKRLAETEGAHTGAIGPSGAEIAIWAGGWLKTYDLATDAPNKVRGNLNPRGAPGWTPDGRILLPPTYWEGFSAFSLDGAPPTPVTTVDPSVAPFERQHESPVFLPNSDVFLARVKYVPSLDPSVPSRLPELVAFRLGDPGEELARTGLASSGPASLIGDHLVYGDGQRVLAVPFDQDTLLPTGTPLTIATNASVYAASPSGLVAFQEPGLSGGTQVLSWIDVAPGGGLTDLAVDRGYFGDVHPSPDGTSILVSVADRVLGTQDLYVYGQDGVGRRLTYGEQAMVGVWSPDGSMVAYLRDAVPGTDIRRGVYVRNADGSGRSEWVAEGHGVFCWSSSGWLLYRVTIECESAFDGVEARWMGAIGNAELSGVPTPAAATREVSAPPHAGCARLSHDGRWLAYCAGRPEEHAIWVRSFGEELGPPVRVSAYGGDCPTWSPNALELAYSEGQRVMLVRFEPPTEDAVTLTPTEPVEVHEVEHIVHNRGLEFSADGTRLLVRRQVLHRTDPITVILNWRP